MKVKKQTLLNKLLVEREDVEVIRASRVDSENGSASDRAAAALQNADLPSNDLIAERGADQIELASPPEVDQRTSKTPTDNSGGRIGI